MNGDRDERDVQESATPGDEAAVAAPPARRRWRWLGFAALGAVLVALAGVGWLFGSESGLRASCRSIEGLLAGRLSLDEPAGALSGSFSLQSAHWRSDTLDIQVQDLQVDWRPLDLLRGRLTVSRLAAANLRIANVATSEPVAVPDSLRLPLAVEIDEMLLGRIEIADYAHPQGKAVSVVESLSGRAASDGAWHRLAELRARVAGLAIRAEANLAADPPFALTAGAGVEGDVAERPLAFDLTADGRLDEFALLGKLRPIAVAAAAGEAVAGQLEARIRPLAVQPIAEVLAKLSGIDPAAWVAGAPQAQLDLRGELRPQGKAGELAGRLTVVNRRPGAVDRQLLPIESLAAGLTLGESELRLADLDVRLSGGGRLQGSGSLRDDQLALRVAVAGLDASALYGGLRRTQLAGPLRATLGLHRQSLEADLRGPQFAIQGKLLIDPAAVVVDTLRLVAGNAQLAASGKVALLDTGAFSLRGTLRDFDPSRFARLPAARLNAEFEAQGSSRPRLALGLRFQLRDSRLGKESLTGSGEMDLAGERLRKADVELTAAGNRLSAKGAFGAPGDLLKVLIAAPRLDPLGITGDLNGQLVLAGSVKLPELAAELRSAHLAVPGLGQMRGLDLEARVGDGSQGPLSGKLRLAGVDLPERPGVLRDIALDADGVRSQHRLRGQLSLPGKRDLRLLLEGGFSAASGGLAWAGTLSELTLASLRERNASFLRLVAAMPLQVTGDRFSAGPAQFAGAGWSARLDRLSYAQQRWQTAGSLQGLPVAATLAEFPESFGALATATQGNGNPLRLSGDWEIGGGAGSSATGGSGAGKRPAATGPSTRPNLPTGRVRLSRESGDLVIGTLPLGLEEGVLSLQVGAGRCEGQLKLRGKRLGEVDGELSASSSADTLIDRQAPWRGQVKLNAPDLAWAGPLVGDGWQLGGRLAGELAVAGTPAQPRLTGEWRGEQLAVRALDQGLRLERGKLLVQLSGEAGDDLRLILKQLVFESDLQPMPRTLLLDPAIDASSLTGRPGRVEATGELRAGQTDGFLTLKADRLGIMQRPDQWILLSGDTQLKVGERVLDIVGSFRIDAAYWELAKSGTPELSEDVVIKRPGTGQAKPSVPARLLSVNLNADLGRHFHFRGAGVESRLVGAVKLRSEGAGLPRATGTIRTRDGRFDAYGQKLDIERGILNFQGLIDNPGLNIRAVRRHLPVEAGVEVTGTARRPIVRLVSDPDVPDAEKLSWLVLGQAPDQQGGKDASVLMAAAQTMLGGQDGGPLKEIQRSLGIDEFGIRTGTLDGSGRWQTSRVASTSGFGTTDSTTDQIVSVGKRLSSNVVLSYDQSLSAAGSVVKLTVDLSRNFSLVGRAGTDTGFDLLWNYRFGREPGK